MAMETEPGPSKKQRHHHMAIPRDGSLYSTRNEYEDLSLMIKEEKNDVVEWDDSALQHLPDYHMTENSLSAGSNATDKAMKSTVKAFQQYLFDCHGLWDPKIELLSREELNRLLTCYFDHFNDNQTSRYKVNSIKCIRANLNRYLKICYNQLKLGHIDIVTDKEFHECKQAYKLSVEKARSNENEAECVEMITPDDEIKMKDYFMKYANDNVVLLHKVYYDLTTLLKKSPSVLHVLTLSDFQLGTDHNGKGFIRLAEEKSLWYMIENPEDHLCPFRSFLFYCSKLSRKTGRLLQHATCKKNCAAAEDWYTGKPFGKQVLLLFIKDISEAAGLSKIYTTKNLMLSVRRNNKYCSSDMVTSPSGICALKAFIDNNGLQNFQRSIHAPIEIPDFPYEDTSALQNSTQHIFSTSTVNGGLLEMDKQSLSSTESTSVHSSTNLSIQVSQVAGEKIAKSSLLSIANSFPSSHIFPWVIARSSASLIEFITLTNGLVEKQFQISSGEPHFQLYVRGFEVKKFKTNLPLNLNSIKVLLDQILQFSVCPGITDETLFTVTENQFDAIVTKHMFGSSISSFVHDHDCQLIIMHPGELICPQCRGLRSNARRHLYNMPSSKYQNMANREYLGCSAQRDEKHSTPDVLVSDAPSRKNSSSSHSDADIGDDFLQPDELTSDDNNANMNSLDSCHCGTRIEHLQKEIDGMKNDIILLKENRVHKQKVTI